MQPQLVKLSILQSLGKSTTGLLVATIISKTDHATIPREK